MPRFPSQPSQRAVWPLPIHLVFLAFLHDTDHYLAFYIVYEFAYFWISPLQYIVQEKVDFVDFAYGSVPSVWPGAWHMVGA